MGEYCNARWWNVRKTDLEAINHSSSFLPVSHLLCCCLSLLLCLHYSPGKKVKKSEKCFCRTSSNMITSIILHSIQALWCSKYDKSSNVNIVFYSPVRIKSCKFGSLVFIHSDSPFSLWMSRTVCALSANTLLSLLYVPPLVSSLQQLNENRNLCVTKPQLNMIWQLQQKIGGGTES